MILGRVVGSVWGGQEAQRLGGRKLVQVRTVVFPPADGPVEVNSGVGDVHLKQGLVLAVDELGAGIGEYVLIAHGSRVRDLTVGTDVPTKEVVIAIVDSCCVEGSWQ